MMLRWQTGSGSKTIMASKPYWTCERCKISSYSLSILSNHTYHRTEHDKQAKKRVADMRDPILIESNSALNESMKIPGIKYLEINVNGKGFERSLVWQLSPYSIMYVLTSLVRYWELTKAYRKLIGLMGLGYRLEAIGILGRQVLQPRGLIGLGYDTIHHCGPEIASVNHYQPFTTRNI